RFWHVTDFHYDNTYFTDQLSCNDEVPEPGPYGDYWCDSPWKLVKSTVDFMAETTRTVSDVDFIIWTGDTIAHISDRDTSLENNLEILNNVTSALDTALSGIPVYASLGNHDFYPSNQAEGKKSNVYREVGNMWKSWISNQVDRFEEGGFYSAPVPNAPKLRLLALNTNLYYTSNKVTMQQKDPAGQLQWMEKHLGDARAVGEKVILTGHVPPGLLTPDLVDWFHKLHRSGFMKVLLHYADVIAATHFGHDHEDGFKILQNSDGSKSLSQFTAPSVTPWRYRLKTPVGDDVGDPHNPGVRLIEYDRDTGAHLNYHQYFINLTDTNTQNRANWAKLYSFQEAYDVKDMSVGSIKTIFDRMKDGGGKKYSDQYCRFRLVSKKEKVCTDKMRGDIYCGGLLYDVKAAEACVDQYLQRINGAQALAIHIFLVQGNASGIPYYNYWTVRGTIIRQMTSSAAK
ncbi:acid sphingomyelinase-like phosphodiesterase 3b, partial [Plakobranchus ocellatus]